MKFKKVLALGLMSVLTVTSLAACSKDGSSTANPSDNVEASNDNTSSSTDSAGEGPVTITVFSQLANFSGEQKGWSADLLLEKFNVKINIVNDPDGSQLTTRMQSGDLGDIVVWGSDGKDYQAAVSSGYLLNWNKDNLLDEHGTYIKENMSNALQKNADLNGGIVYGFGHDVAYVSEGNSSIKEMFYTWDTRWDLYDQLGQPEIKNLDDYLDLMIKMKEICPLDENGKETYAVSMWPAWDGNMVMYVKAFATAYYGYDEFDFGLYDPDTGTFYDCLAEDGPYMASLRFINKLYQNGLVDPNSMTQEYDTMKEKVIAGGVFFSIFNYSGSMMYNNEKHVSENKMMLPLIPTEAVPLNYGLSDLGGNRVWSIGASTKYPELCMDIINWLCTPEGVMTYFYGPQGTCWDYDEEGYSYLTEFGLSVQTDREQDMIGGYSGSFNDGCLQINNTTFSQSSVNPASTKGETFYYTAWEKMQADPLCEIQAKWREFAGANTATGYVLNKCNYKIKPEAGYQTLEAEGELLLSWNLVADEIVNGSWKAIYAKTDEEFEQLVAEMVSKAKEYGYDECIEFSRGNAEILHQLEEATRE